MDPHEAALSRPVLRPVVVPRPAAMLAEVLREKILSGEFPEGEPLPPERTLVEQSRLSRNVVREALATLKQQGLLETRPGRHGGTIVTRPSVADLRDSLEIYIQSQGWHAATPALRDIREIVEPWCAALAAARGTAEHLETLRRRLGAMERAVSVVSDYVEASLSWHFAVADASGNALLTALMHARSQDVVTAASHARYAELASRVRTVELHEQITRAIEAREPRTAFDLMEAHVRAEPGPLLDRLGAETPG